MNTKETLVSIIVPVYNVSQYLEKCILSIINQSLKNIEIILIDDGSTDMSGAICDKFLEVDSRIKVIHKKNNGLVAARKSGLKIAEGKYIGFVDGDDYIAVNMYENLYKIIEKSNADFAYSGMTINKKKCYCLPNGIIDIDDSEEIISKYFLDIDSDMSIGATLCTKLFRANIIKEAYKVVPNGQSVGEDSIATLECLFKCKKIVLVDQAYYFYSIRENSITHAKNIDKIVQETSLFNCMKNILERYCCSNNAFHLLEKRYLVRLLGKLMEKKCSDIPIFNYYFSKYTMLYNKKIAIYGAGSVGQGYYAHFSCINDCEVVAWVDQEYNNKKNSYKQVESIQKLLTVKYDYLVIAVKNKGMAMDIQKKLIEMGINEKKILWETPKSIIQY